MIGTEGTRLLQEYGAGETPQAHAPRRLTATPAESEVPEVEINKLLIHSQ
jgi:hypothetical protein